jgi:hypothetical protein
VSFEGGDLAVAVAIVSCTISEWTSRRGRLASALVGAYGYRHRESPFVADGIHTKDLAELMRFRHVVRHLYSYELERGQVLRLLQKAILLWTDLIQELQTFEAWLQDVLRD